ncbi:MAG: signal peptidase I [Candidatus Stahlbacteria bacterium]|nr:signal peptidase I [Candidatus Stahlbacteria bacterium]
MKIERRKMKKKSKMRKWVEDIVFIVCAVLLIRAFIVQAYRIPSGSMEPTLLIGDQLFACKFFYGIKIPFTDKRILEVREPRQGDIVIFRYPYERKDFVKRCIAVEGDAVEIKDKSLYVNNKLTTDSYAYFGDPTLYPKLPDLPPSFEYQRAWEQNEFKNAVRMVRDNFGPVRVPANCIFVMGDNRDFSYDGRYWGPLNKKWLLGKPLLIHFSWDSKPPLYKIWQKVRWQRMGRIID